MRQSAEGITSGPPMVPDRRSPLARVRSCITSVIHSADESCRT
jgi:hypothetical protein